MPIKNKEVEAFYQDLLKKATLPDNERQLLESLLERDDVSSVFEGGIKSYRRLQSDLDANKKYKEQLEAEYTKKISDVTALRETLAAAPQATAAEKARASQLEEALRKAQGDLGRVVSKIKEFDDGDEVLKQINLSSVPDYLSTISTSSYTPPPNNQHLDNKNKSLSIEEIMKQISGPMDQRSAALAQWPVDLMKMSRQYHSLTGKELDVDEFTNAVKQSGNPDYWQVFNETYDIPGLQRKQQEDQIRAQFQKEFEEKLEAEKAKLTIPGGAMPVPQNSDFFNAIESTIPKEELQNRNPSGVVDRNSLLSDAVADFRKNTTEKVA